MNKVMLITTSFNVGGIERNIQLLSSALIDKGMDVEVLVLHNGKRYINYDERATITVPDRVRGKSSISKLYYRLMLPSFIRNAVKKSNPDVVLSMSDTFNGIVVMSCMGLKTKVFIQDVTKPDFDFFWFTKLMKNLFYTHSSGFVAQTHAAAVYYKKKFDNKLNIKVIEPIVNKVAIDTNIKREKIILNVGRLSIEKGQDRMIEIFSMIPDKKGWKLWFTADGPLKPKLIELIKKHNLEDSVELLGYVEDLNVLYNKVSIFALPSRFEGYPNALVEAMSAQLPTIVFNSFPAHEIVNHEQDGYIIEDGEFEKFRDYLELLMNDEELRFQIGLKAKQKVEHLTPNGIISQYIDFFQTNNRI